jgi:hypothetical protein
MIESGVPNWNFVGLDWVSVEEADGGWGNYVYFFLARLHPCEHYNSASTSCEE